MEFEGEVHDLESYHRARQIFYQQELQQKALMAERDKRIHKQKLQRRGYDEDDIIQ